eukprot:4729044-Pleurochrysis_carterae.AAC.6
MGKGWVTKGSVPASLYEGQAEAERACDAPDGWCVLLLGRSSCCDALAAPAAPRRRKRRECATSTYLQNEVAQGPNGWRGVHKLSDTGLARICTKTPMTQPASPRGITECSKLVERCWNRLRRIQSTQKRKIGQQRAVFIRIAASARQHISEENV